MKKACLLLMLTSLCLSSYAQRDVGERTGWSPKERMYFGLGIGGLGFGQDASGHQYYSIGLTPMTGYMLAKGLSGGLAFEFVYQGIPDLKETYIQYGWYPFLRYNVFKSIFIQTDYDWYSLEDSAGERDIYNRFMAGLGYSSKGGGRTAVNFLVSYDLMYAGSTSRFNSPFTIRIFLTF